MNILYTNFHRGDGGGQTTYVLSLLENNPHTTFVACPEGSKLHTLMVEWGYKNYIPVDFPAKPKQFIEVLKNTLRLRRAIIDNNIDIVHTNGSPDNRMTLYAALLTRKKFRVVYTKHNAIRVKNAVSRFRLRRFNDAVIFVADVIEMLGFDKTDPRFHVIPNGIDLDYWRRQSPPETGHRLTLISNAGASRHKGWHHLTEAIAGLDPEEKKRLSVVMLARHEAEMARELEEAASVCDFSRPGFFADVRPYLEKADIGFVLSYKEACSFACREMMAMGLPVVTSDYITLTAAIDKSCGWVTKLKDADSIRQTLRAILALRPEEITAMKGAARARAEADFGIRDMLDKTYQVYEGLMKK